MSSIAIIPARGGSKRIPRKNLQLVNGKPLISYPILAALQSGVFSDVFVSTDDSEISEIAQSYGAKVPFIRSADLSDDLTPTIPVVRDAILRFLELGIEFENCCCLYPTSIFVSEINLQDSCAQFLETSETNFLVSVVKYPYPIQRALRLSTGNKINFLNPEYASTRTQDLVGSFHDAAQFYWGRKNHWLESDSVFSNASGFLMDSSKIQDIDDLEDLRRAELLFKSALI
jgi:N-acylneuraminate cytidylyltransferase